MTPEEKAHRKNVFFEVFDGLPRLGPGDVESTKRAFSMLSTLPSRPRILDIGCGTGAQTLELARLSDGDITAIDHHQSYLDALSERARHAGLSTRITTRLESMAEFPITAPPADLIWAEGSIYVIGFERGLREWRRLLEDGGYIAVTHLSWLTSNVPSEAKQFWEEEKIVDVEENLSIIAKSGYRVLGHFTLPASAWWNDYYIPLEKRVAVARMRYADDAIAHSLIENIQTEINLYRDYSNYYGYEFYVMRKT
jgi:ubiquinone/menaquinone biosynthesis C-methylase UbiE